ncbi:MAG: MXAN_5187 C-terminal domain-containing protein, partial [Sandaracinaceae bacterium]
PPPRRPPPPPGGENRKKRYADYISARRQNSERTDNMSYDKLEKSVKKMKDRLRQKHGDRKIDFEVVLQNGRVGLKPKIK